MLRRTRNKRSTTDSESGYFVKGGRERLFAYRLHTACDRNGFVLGTVVEPANIHDSQVFTTLFQQEKSALPSLIRPQLMPDIKRRLSQNS